MLLVIIVNPLTQGCQQIPQPLYRSSRSRTACTPRVKQHRPEHGLGQFALDLPHEVLAAYRISTAAMNRRAMSPSIRRSRFLVNTVSSDTSASNASPTNQRNSRL